MSCTLLFLLLYCIMSTCTGTGQKVVLLSGWLQSGKDTVGGFLQELGYQRYAFADILKDKCAREMGVPRLLMDTTIGKESQWKGATVRTHLINYGQNARASDPFIWVREACKSAVEDRHPLVVFTDWRMKDEFDFVVDTFGRDNVTCVRIHRWDEPPLADITECQLDTFDFDVHIKNRGSLQDLRSAVLSNLGNSQEEEVGISRSL